MDNTEKQIAKVEKLLELISEEYVKPDEAEAIFTAILALIEKTKTELSQEMATNKGEMTSAHKEMYGEMEDMQERMKTMHTKMEDKMAVDKKEMMTQCMKMVKDLEMMMPQMPKEFDPTDILKRVNEIENKIPKIPDEITPDQIANKLNELEEVVDIEVIKGLKKKLEDLEKKWVSRPIFGGGGGFSVGAMNFHFSDDETPTGTVNGVNTDFVIANTPSPTSSLKVFKDGQRIKITTDYTFTGRTITFLSAPLTDTIITVDYRT